MTKQELQLNLIIAKGLIDQLLNEPDTPTQQNWQTYRYLNDITKKVENQILEGTKHAAEIY